MHIAEDWPGRLLAFLMGMNVGMAIIRIMFAVMDKRSRREKMEVYRITGIPTHSHPLPPRQAWEEEMRERMDQSAIASTTITPSEEEAREEAMGPSKDQSRPPEAVEKQLKG